MLARMNVMTSNSPNTDHPNPPESRRSSSLLVVGTVLWTCCLIGVFYCWNQWREGVQKRKSETAVQSADDNEGRATKQFKLVLQKDGSLVPEEVTAESQQKPWSKDGIDDFSFTDTEGQKLVKQDLLGKPFIIGFIFTHCRGPCPDVTRQMREIQDRLKDYDFNLVTLTVDPERDTTEVLKNYGKNSGANFDRWKFLTGKQSEIYGLIHHSFLMPVEEAQGPARQPGFEIIHSRNIMLVDAAGRVVGKYDAVSPDDIDMARLRKDLKNLAKPITASDKAAFEGNQ